jgi:hypothetical protein
MVAINPRARYGRFFKVDADRTDTSTRECEALLAIRTAEIFESQKSIFCVHGRFWGKFNSKTFKAYLGIPVKTSILGETSRLGLANTWNVFGPG